MRRRNNQRINVEDMRPGDSVLGFYMVRLCEIKVTTTNTKYVNLTLSDNTGEINAKMWEFRGDTEPCKTGEIVKVQGLVVDWQGIPQVKIERIRPAADKDNIDPSDYVPCAPYPPEDMYNYLYDKASSFSNQSLKDIVLKLLEENKEVLLYYPAAKKNHHAVRSGLLYHIITMMRSAEKLSEVYDFLNKDLLFSGVILHDIGKISEMDSNSYGIVSGYTVEGNLLGHIIQGIRMIEKSGEQVGADPEVVMLLSHMILSHHYHPEYGSPKYPMIPEAELLHYLDIMDARMYDMRRASEFTDKGQFSDRIWSLENRQVYKPGI